MVRCCIIFLCLFVALFPCALFSAVSLLLWPSLALSSSPGPPWPLISSRPFPCCSFPTSLRVARCYGVFFCLFVSFVIPLPLVFPFLLAPFLSSSLPSFRGGLVLLVLELMALCYLLSPFFFCRVHWLLFYLPLCFVELM